MKGFAMSPPPLRIPIGLDMTGFKNGMENSKALTSHGTKFIVDQFIEMNSKIGGPVLSGLTANFSRAAVGIAGKLALVIGSLKLMGGAVDAVRDQLAGMVSIAEKASAVSVSPEFFQQFIEGAGGAKDKVELFEQALQRSFEALKPVLNPDWSVWDEGITKVSAIETEMRSLRELFETGQNSSGLDLFRNANTNDERILAVLKFMKQLRDIGQEVAAIDLADKLFGAKFSDQLRTGQKSIDGLIETVQTKTDTMFSNNAVLRAKELDDQLNQAWRTVDQNLQPSLEALDVVGLKIKSAWVEIVKLIGQAAKLLPGAPSSGVDVNATARAQEAQLLNRLRDSGLTSQQRAGVEEQLRAVQSKLAQAEASQVPQAPAELGIGLSSERIPLPQRRPDDVPKPTATPAATMRNKFESAADSVEKRIAGLQAEADAINLTAAARDRAKLAAELETVAKQANAAAGLGANVVTAEQRAQIDKLADSYGRVAEKIEQSRSPLATYMREAADLSKQLNTAAASSLETISDSLTDVVMGTKSAADAFRSMASSIIADLARIMIRKAITGLLSWAISGNSDGGQIKAFADGGVIRGPGGPRSDSIVARVSAGEYIVNAEATSRHLQLLEAINSGRLPAYADGGYVAPAVPVIRGGDAGVNVTFAPQVDARGADVAAVTRLEQALARQQREFEGRVRRIVADRPNKRW
ncbi:MAG: hypothetical protein EWM45_04800 [Rhodopseudomonas palustris]|nr:MAG: hypothetical protein EWM45_04800 [Rhodopseudomonas palustris]